MALDYSLRATLAGTDIRPWLRRSSLVIDDNLNRDATMATFIVNGGSAVVPQIGQDVKLAIGFLGAPIAIGFDNAASGGFSSTSTSHTFAYTCGASATLLRIGVIGDSTSDLVTSATYNTIPMKVVAKTNPGNNVGWMYVFDLVNPPTGSSYNIVVSASSTCSLIGFEVSSYIGGIGLVGGADTGALFYGTSGGSPATTFGMSVTPYRGNWIWNFTRQLAGTAITSTGVIRVNESSDGLASIVDSGDEVIIPTSIADSITGSAVAWGGIQMGTYFGAPGGYLFAGTVRRVQQGYDKQLGNVNWTVTAVDYAAWLFNRRRPVKSYVSQSVSSVVVDLVSTFSTGFTTTHVVGSLGTVTVSFDGTSDLGSCLTYLANLIGAYWYIDTSKDVHFFTSESDVLPDPLQAGNTTAQIDPVVEQDTDASQLRTRMIVVGGTRFGGATTVAMPGATAGASIIPVVEAAGFNPSGQALITVPIAGTYPSVLAHYVVNYAGVNLAGLITPPTNGPTFTSSASGGNVPSGNLYYAVSWRTGAGETGLSPYLGIFLGSGSQQVTLDLRGAGLPAQNVLTVQVYRSIANGQPTLLFAAGSVTQPSGGWSSPIPFVDTIADSSLGAPNASSGPAPQGIQPPYNTIANVPQLAGVSSGAIGGAFPTLPVGTPIQVCAVVDDTAAQTAQAALEGGDGIHEVWITDTNAVNPSLCRARGLAELAINKAPVKTFSYPTRDLKTRAGRTITVNLGSPNNLSGSFVIQRAQISQIDVNGQGNVPPLFVATASSVRYSLEDFLRQLNGLLTISGTVIG
jgi:hypothetical protein